MSVMLPRVGVSGARDSAPQGEVSGLLRGTPPAVYDTSRGKPPESDGGVRAHCNSSALCVPTEDPGGTVPLLRSSAAGCYNLVENSGSRTPSGNSHKEEEQWKWDFRFVLSIIFWGQIIQTSL